MDTVFLVDKKILSLSSAVFKAMLAHGPNAGAGEAHSVPGFPRVSFECENVTADEPPEAHPSNLLDLPRFTFLDENIVAMMHILHAIHLQSDQVPKEVSYSLLHELAMICDKYDLRRGLGTWPQTWAKFWTPNTESARKDLFITFTLKLHVQFRDISRKIILHAVSPDAGDLLELGDDDFLGLDIPLNLLGERLCPTETPLLTILRQHRIREVSGAVRN